MRGVVSVCVKFVFCRVVDDDGAVLISKAALHVNQFAGVGGFVLLIAAVQRIGIANINISAGNAGNLPFAGKIDVTGSFVFQSVGSAGKHSDREEIQVSAHQLNGCRVGGDDFTAVAGDGHGAERNGKGGGNGEIVFPERQRVVSADFRAFRSDASDQVDHRSLILTGETYRVGKGGKYKGLVFRNDRCARGRIGKRRFVIDHRPAEHILAVGVIGQVVRVQEAYRFRRADGSTQIFYFTLHARGGGFTGKRGAVIIAIGCGAGAGAEKYVGGAVREYPPGNQAVVQFRLLAGADQTAGKPFAGHSGGRGAVDNPCRAGLRMTDQTAHVIRPGHFPVDGDVDQRQMIFGMPDHRAGVIRAGDGDIIQRQLLNGGVLCIAEQTCHPVFLDVQVGNGVPRTEKNSAERCFRGIADRGKQRQIGGGVILCAQRNVRSQNKPDAFCDFARVGVKGKQAQFLCGVDGNAVAGLKRNGVVAVVVHGCHGVGLALGFFGGGGCRYAEYCRERQHHAQRQSECEKLFHQNSPPVKKLIVHAAVPTAGTALWNLRYLNYNIYFLFLHIIFVDLEK